MYIEIYIYIYTCLLNFGYIVIALAIIPSCWFGQPSPQAPRSAPRPTDAQVLYGLAHAHQDISCCEHQ